VSNNIDFAGARTNRRRGLGILKTLHDAGVTILAGTDGAVPGHSLLRTLELYVEAGMTPAEAIGAATIVPAKVMRMENELGTIEKGKRADLLVLDADPLTSISNIRKGRWVVANGRIYDCAALWRSVGFAPQQ
jgi:imidazolonepropionase-like amidohydrolase